MSEQSWETLTSRVAYTCDGFDIVNQTVRLPDGTEAEFDYLSENESVVVLPFRTDGKVVVIDEWRQAVERLNRGLPAGGLEAGEHPDDAAHRELLEETGHEAGTVEYLTSIEPANGFSDALFHYYVAHDCERASGQELDVDETISVSTATVDELLEALGEGTLRDGRSAFAITYYALFEQRDE